MFKNIPKNDISRRNFKSYKRWVQTNQESPSILIYDGDVVFDVETADSSSGYFSKPIYRSIKSKYYSNGGDVIKTFGLMNPLYEFEVVRNLTETASVIHIPQIHYGERIKPNSVTLTNLVTSESFTDDGWGNLILSSTGSLVGIDYDYLLKLVQTWSENTVLQNPTTATTTELLTFIEQNFIKRVTFIN